MSTADAPMPVAPEVPGPAPHLLLVRAPYYRDVVDGMTRGARRVLEQAGATHDVLDVAVVGPPVTAREAVPAGWVVRPQVEVTAEEPTQVEVTAKEPRVEHEEPMHE